MNPNWSEPYHLEERLNTGPPDIGVYRIWYQKQDSTLAYIGESSNISSRLYKHERTFGKDALFAYAEESDLDAPHKRKEIETDLIGAHYLVNGEAPLAQFGHIGNVSPWKKKVPLITETRHKKWVVFRKSCIWYLCKQNFCNFCGFLEGCAVITVEMILLPNSAHRDHDTSSTNGMIERARCLGRVVPDTDRREHPASRGNRLVKPWMA